MLNHKRAVALSLLLSASVLLLQPAWAAPEVQVGFSPEGSAQRLVLSVIDEAQNSIRLMGYSFTSPPVVRALMAAQRRGVDVAVVLDDQANRNRAGMAAMNLLVSAGVAVRTVDAYKSMHDKMMVVDGMTTETGSFNFSRSADRSNSENVVVMKDMPAVAKTYLAHWQSRWDQGRDWRSDY